MKSPDTDDHDRGADLLAWLDNLNLGVYGNALIEVRRKETKRRAVKNPQSSEKPAARLLLP